MLCFVKVIFLCKLNPFPFIKVGITKNLGQIQILSKSQLEQKQNDGRGGGEGATDKIMGAVRHSK